MGGRQSCEWRDEGGGRGKLAQDSAGKHCYAASSTEHVVGGRDGWRLTKAVVMVAMMGMCLRMGGIPGTAGSWRLGRGEKHQRCMVRGQLGSQCSLGWCNHDPVTRVPWVGAMVEEGDLLGALSG